MTTRTIPARGEVPLEHRWDVESIFATPQAWDEEFDAVGRDLPALARLRA